MFIRVETYNRFIPLWKSISYINLSNVLHMEVSKNKVDIYTIFRPTYSAYRINFESEHDAKQFTERVFANLPQVSPHESVTIQKRFRHDEANPDMMAITALSEYDTQNQLK